MVGTLIIIPTYNEKENVAAIAHAVLDVLPEAHVLFVDDNSPDGTGAVLDSLSAGDSRVRVIHRAGKLGLGTAYLEGFQTGLRDSYRLFIEMDADFSHDPKYLRKMVELATDRADVVVGSRYVPGGGTKNWGLVRKFVSKGGGLYARTILGIRIMDLTAGFVCYRRNVLEALDLGTVRSEGYGFQIEMKYRVLKRGFRIEEMPIVFEDRRAGESKMSPRIFLEALLMVWALRWKKEWQ